MGKSCLIISRIMRLLCVKPFIMGNLSITETNSIIKAHHFFFSRSLRTFPPFPFYTAMCIFDRGRVLPLGCLLSARPLYLTPHLPLSPDGPYTPYIFSRWHCSVTKLRPGSAAPDKPGNQTVLLSPNLTN